MASFESAEKVLKTK